MWQEQVIHDYFSAWLLKDGQVLDTVFSEDILYSECYGPEYHGIKQVQAWFTDWNKRGTVLEWTIKRFIHQGCMTVAEWFFRCEYDNTIDGFDGVSIIKFDANGKIEELSEFQSKSEHCYPYEYIESDAIIETDRLYLREMQQTDYASLYCILQDEAVMYAYEGVFSDAEAQAWLEKQLKNYEEYGFGLWAVVLKETNEMIGQCGLTMQAYDDKQVLEVGYLFQKAFWHQGFAAEAAIACKNYAFEKLGAEEVFSIIRDTNIASQNVAKRNGMAVKSEFVKHYRGVEMPHFVFSVKRESEVKTKIRRLIEEDADIISEIVCRNFLEVNIKDYSKMEMENLTKAYNNEKILEMSRWAHSYVACVDDKIVGCGSIASYWGKEDESILLTIFVLPELHGKGIGTRIIKALENDEYFLRAKRIEIPASITACDFYRKLGYSYKNGIKELDGEGHYRLEKFNVKETL